MAYKRPSWDEYFLEMAEFVGKRGTCDRGRNGCVIVKDKHVLSTGYVGAPTGFPHCDEVGHLLREVIEEDGTKSVHCVRTLHAEQNAIIQAAKFGVSIDGATLYTKMVPCRTCTMMIINAGIKRVVARRHYHADRESIEMMKFAGIQLDIMEDSVEEYPDQKRDQ